MATACAKLNAVLSSYIDGGELNTTDLRQHLKGISPEQALQLLGTVRDSHQGTVIHVAAERDDVELLTCFLDSLNADQLCKLVFVQDANGSTALHHIARSGNIKVVTHICSAITSEQRYELLRIQDKIGYAPLHAAAKTGQSDLITPILESINPAQQSEILAIVDNSKRRAFDIAMLENHQSTADLLKQCEFKAKSQTVSDSAKGEKIFC